MNTLPDQQPAISAPTGVAMFATAVCPFCSRAEQFLRSKGVLAIEKIMVDKHPAERARMAQLAPGSRTVPQIFIAGTHIGGCDDLLALASKDPERLAALLAQAA